MQVLRFFNDELTGDECAIAWNGREEICITANQAYDIFAEEDYFDLQSMMEIGG